MDPVGQDINLNSPNKGLGPTGGVDSLTGVSMEGGATGVAAVNTLPPGLTEEEAEELYSELGKVEEEINTLRQVLLAKERHSADLKRKLGLSPLNELKQNLTKGWQDVQTSNAYLTASATLDDIAQSEAYKKTSETLSVAGQKTTAAFSTMGTALSRKLGDMRALPFSNSFGSNYSIRQSISMPTMRNSPTFKSFEDKVGNIKYMVVGPRGNGEAVQSPTETTNPVQDNAPF
ncbi:tumor protein D54 isoform X15 [Salmo salar]|uniref:Tumor protein D54 isoform X15 n=1 Tax=Salmo salar TaxID=8030 RepID=A0A1S3MI73_SALSA|nr:tumor protein D54 isoform X15 [Salmo salar]|eukprot:XP_014002913.1 PREDICTED: tumor protein D54-like isoform X13 [Salmo salar]